MKYERPMLISLVEGYLTPNCEDGANTGATSCMDGTAADRNGCETGTFFDTGQCGYGNGNFSACLEGTSAGNNSCIYGTTTIGRSRCEVGTIAS